MLHISDISVSAGSAAILHTLTLKINPGDVHAIMGRNGSGKSTLAYALMGHPGYSLTAGSIIFNGSDISQYSPDKRAKQGIFLAFQHPLEIPGVTVFTFLQEAYRALHAATISAIEFKELLEQCATNLNIDHLLLYRPMNAGFSGGEKKRLELLQLSLFKPKLAILDELDSGLDIDAFALVMQGLSVIRAQNPEMAIIIITHYHKMLTAVQPDYVHIIHKGRIVATGDAMLADSLEKDGFEQWIAAHESE